MNGLRLPPLYLVSMPWWYSKHPVLVWIPLHVMYITFFSNVHWANDSELCVPLTCSVTDVSLVNAYVTQ